MKIVLTSLFALCLFTPHSAYAQFLPQDETAEEQQFGTRPVVNQYTYNNKERRIQQTIKAFERRKQGYFQPQNVHLSLKRYPYLDDGQFAIHMSVPEIVNGCYDISGIQYETSFIADTYLEIKISEYRRTPVNQHIGGKCDMRNQQPTADIVFDANDLKSRGIQKIRFISDMGTDFYVLDIENDSVRLTPENEPVLFKPVASDNVLQTYLATSNLVYLYAPMALPEDAVKDAIQRLAAQKGLGQSNINNIKSNTGGVIFTDPSGRITQQLEETDFIDFGTISVNRPFHASNGLRAQPVALRVLARRP